MIGLRMPVAPDVGLMQVPDGVALLVRDLVHEHTGIFFENGRLDLLLDKLRPLVRSRQQSFMEYYYVLKYEDRRTEWARVADALSVQETYFWREMPQIRALVDVIVPAWFQRNKGPLRIWSAACATGEEPYTIAIALEEAGWAGHPVEIWASDASEGALMRAARGVYRERSFRSLPIGLRGKYFTEVEEGWRIDPMLAARVKFRRANLVSSSEVRQLASIPVIFCRNVFIYFSPEAIRRTLSHFAEVMPGGSHLFVGISESLLKMTSDFDLREIGSAFVYERKAARGT